MAASHERDQERLGSRRQFLHALAEPGLPAIIIAGKPTALNPTPER